MSARIFFDSSVVLAHVFGELDSFSFPEGTAPLASELMEVECRRVLDRIRVHERLSDEEAAERISELNAMVRGFRLVALGPRILERAKAPYPTVVRTLDALHLATAELGKATLFVTRDDQQAAAAEAIGLRVNRV